MISPAMPSLGSHPLHRPAADTVSRLRESRIFADYQLAFETATELPLVLRPAGVFDAPVSGANERNTFCALVAATDPGRAARVEQQRRLEDAATAGTRSVAGLAGLVESALPVRIGDRVIAFLQTGPVLHRPPTEAAFRRVLKQLSAWNATLDQAPLREAFFQLRVIPRVQYDAILRLVESFAGHLSLLSNELMIAESGVESPVVARARAFIAEHLGDDLSLGAVAGAMHVSPTYFCKLFKAELGLTFTDYLARVRVETVKHALLNPHTRISEAAFEAGFQSLSQFNRVFRRVAGQSPSTYRDRLHGPGPRATLAFAA
jgi:AraC-like DNA-binding protein